MKKIFIKHNGCLNLSYDFNIAKSGLEKSGYEFVNNPNDASNDWGTCVFISSPDEIPKVSQGVGLYLKPVQIG